jgi:hypothetical protein
MDAFALWARAAPAAGELLPALVRVAAAAAAAPECADALAGAALGFLPDCPRACAGALAEFVAGIAAVAPATPNECWRFCALLPALGVDTDDTCLLMRNLVLADPPDGRLAAEIAEWALAEEMRPPVVALIAAMVERWVVAPADAAAVAEPRFGEWFAREEFGAAAAELFLAIVVRVKEGARGALAEHMRAWIRVADAVQLKVGWMAWAEEIDDATRVYLWKWLRRRIEAEDDEEMEDPFAAKWIAAYDREAVAERFRVFVGNAV